MVSRVIMVVGFASFSGFLFGQQAAQSPAIGYEDTYQLDYMDVQGSINFTNAGFHASPTFPARSSDICVNAYIFNPITNVPDGPLGAVLSSCCSCRVTPDSAGSITPTISGPVVVKLVATLPTPSGPPCDATVLPKNTLASPGGYASGMRAWTISQPTVLSDQLSTSKFINVALGNTEQTKLTQLCAAAPKCSCH